MSKSYTVYVRLCAMFFVLMFSSVAFGGATKVDVCHFPPGDLENFHTIRISEKAVASHLKHGDLEGACEVDPEISCPCFDQADLDALGAPQFCDPNVTEKFAFFSGFTACSGDGSSDFGPCTNFAAPTEPGCALTDGNGAGPMFEGLLPEEDEACRAIITETCM